MQVYIYKSAELAARAASMIFVAELYQKPDAVLGLATGSTPLLTYKELIRLHREGLLDFSRVRSFNLDEYVDLSPEHDQSYRYYMNENLFRHINIDPENTFVPSGLGDVESNARAYDLAIERAGGIDLQLLGIGHNGHIGFNEPDDKFAYPTHVVDLTESTMQANGVFFPKGDMPKRAITLGIGGIMRAKRIVLLATGEGKAEAIRAAVHGDIDPSVPASILRTHHNVQFLLDEGAASRL